MHKLRVALRTMFKAVFDRFGEADAPDIDRVTLRLPDRHTPRHARNLDCYLQIDFAKGLELLKANLTPAQRAMYEEKRYFEVKGGTTGKTYRIHHGRQMNIHEMDDEGKAVCGICFLPQGGLVAGDCMLAQKTALELFEDDALKVANLFPVHTSFVPEEGPRGRPGYGRSALEAFGIRWRVDENLPAGTIRVVPGA